MLLFIFSVYSTSFLAVKDIPPARHKLNSFPIIFYISISTTEAYLYIQYVVMTQQKSSCSPRERHFVTEGN